MKLRALLLRAFASSGGTSLPEQCHRQSLHDGLAFSAADHFFYQ
jgi:hypothetical protein